MDTACTRTFVDVDYRKRRRDVLFERERAYFSEAQVEVEVIRAIKRGQAISDQARNDFHTVFRAHGLEYGRVTIGEMRDFVDTVMKRLASQENTSAIPMS